MLMCAYCVVGWVEGGWHQVNWGENVNSWRININMHFIKKKKIKIKEASITAMSGC